MALASPFPATTRTKPFPEASFSGFLSLPASVSSPSSSCHSPILFLPGCLFYSSHPRTTCRSNRIPLFISWSEFHHLIAHLASQDLLRRKNTQSLPCAHTTKPDKPFPTRITHPPSIIARSLAFNNQKYNTSLLRNMLLPSALSCDVRRPSRFAATRLLSTPPPSDDEVPMGNGLLGTCRALQSLLNGSPAPSPRHSKPARLQSPVHIRSTPSSSRSRRLATPSSPERTPERRPRGVNKRRRDHFEADEDNDNTNNDNHDATVDHSASRNRFSTPKRRRHAPYNLPLGLSQTDFYSLNSPPITASPSSPRYQNQQDSSAQQPYNPDSALPSIEVTDDSTRSNQWTEEDDQRLMETVFEKFQLSKKQWNECAQRIGKDQASVERRWQALVGQGNIALRR